MTPFPESSIADPIERSGSNRRPDSARPKGSGNLLRRARLLHLYLGTFFAPSILFFSLTGAAQVVNWHETTPGSSYKPPVWLEKLAQVHKKQTLATRPKGGAPPRPAERSASRPLPEGQDASLPAQPRNTPPRTTLGTSLLKGFFFVMSLSLATTTLLGIYMAFKYNRDRRLIWGMLVVGTIVPVALLCI